MLRDRRVHSEDGSMEGAEKIYSNLRFCSNVEAGESN